MEKQSKFNKYKNRHLRMRMTVDIMTGIGHRTFREVRTILGTTPLHNGKTGGKQTTPVPSVQKRLTKGV